MKEKTKIIGLLMLVLIGMTVLMSEFEIYLDNNGVFCIAEIAATLFIYIALSYFVVEAIFEIIGLVNKKNIYKTDTKLETLVSNIPGGIISLSYTDKKWKVNYVSLWCYKFLGYNKKSEVDMEKVFDSIFELGRSDIDDILNNILLGSEYGEAEVKVKDANGEFIWVKVKINGIYSSNGELNRVTAIIIDINDVKVENENLLFKVQHDSMTGVLNKGTIEEIVEEYTRDKKGKAAFIIVDIDNFKLFNDLLGHIYGDEAIIKVVECLKIAFSNKSYIARLGGDEFCVFVTDINSKLDVVEMVESFLNTLRKYKIGDEKKLNILVSIGISEFPKYGHGFRELYINSDKALYATKGNGKNGYSIYDEKEMN